MEKKKAYINALDVKRKKLETKYNGNVAELLQQMSQVLVSHEKIQTELQQQVNNQAKQIDALIDRLVDINQLLENKKR
jgi:ribosomal protein L17